MAFTLSCANILSFPQLFSNIDVILALLCCICSLIISEHKQEWKVLGWARHSLLGNNDAWGFCKCSIIAYPGCIALHVYTYTHRHISIYFIYSVCKIQTQTYKHIFWYILYVKFRPVFTNTLSISETIVKCLILLFLCSLPI